MWHMPTRRSLKLPGVAGSGTTPSRHSAGTLLLGLFLLSLGPACGAGEPEMEQVNPVARSSSDAPTPNDVSDLPSPAAIDGDGRPQHTATPPAEITKPAAPIDGDGRPEHTTATPPAELAKPAASADELPEVSTGVAAALIQLRSEYPDLELLCPDEACVQEADLDGDRKADVVLPVRAKCDKDPCPMGVVVVPTKAPEIRIAAGTRTRIRHVDWELIDGKLVWESLGKAATLRSTQGLKIRATSKSLCARSMRIRRAILEFDGGDAIEALMFRRGQWVWAPCGY